jgi:hypothetical protein
VFGLRIAIAAYGQLRHERDHHGDREHHHAYSHEQAFFSGLIIALIGDVFLAFPLL